MNSSLAQRQELVIEQLAEARNQIVASQAKLLGVDKELEGLSEQRQRYDLLGEAYDALEKLEELGASNLFWGNEAGNFDVGQRMAVVRDSVTSYRAEMDRYQERRTRLLSEIADQELLIDELNYKLEELNELIQRAQEEFVVEREITRRPYQPAILPWNRQGEDQRRYRKVLLLTLLFMLFIGGVPLVWKLPPKDTSKVVAVDERIAEFIKNKPKPKPPEPPKQKPKEEKVEDKPKEETKPKDTTKPKPTTEEVKVAKATAQNTAALAALSSLNMSELLDETPQSLGADSRASNKGSTAAGGSLGTRSLIVANAGSGSGGIANSARSVGGAGGGSGGAITGGGAGTGKRSSAIAAIAAEDKPVGGGGGSSRSHEEIQIVFDRHKSALYRIYNRELRNDPSLRGKLVLALTIEPDGRVSMCRVQSSDLNSPALEAEIVERVKKFDFGAKEGVPAAKISYPIDFYPPG